MAADGGCSDSAFILAALAALLLIIATLGALGFGVGFDVFPIGEDNNWIDMLQRGRGAEAARLFWAIDHRNPLSPWWYIAARPIILGFDAGLLALRYAIAALLAFAAYCMAAPFSPSATWRFGGRPRRAPKRSMRIRVRCLDFGAQSIAKSDS